MKFPDCIDTITSRLTAVLLSIPFLIALVCLLGNDYYLKAAYPGWTTGKLSDFAGLYVVGAILFAIFPRQRIAVALGICTAFAYWKSPYSTPLVEFANSLLPVRLGRVVDYSDLLALVMLPIAAQTTLNCSGSGSAPRLRRVGSYAVGTITLLGIMGTSVMMPTSDFTIRNLDPNTELSPEDWLNGISLVAYDHGLELHNGHDDQGVYVSDDATLHYWIEDNSVRFVVRSNKMRGIILKVPDATPADRIRSQLRYVLAELSPDMEYVEPIR